MNRTSRDNIKIETGYQIRSVISKVLRTIFVAVILAGFALTGFYGMQRNATMEDGTRIEDYRDDIKNARQGDVVIIGDNKIPVVDKILNGLGLKKVQTYEIMSVPFSVVYRDDEPVQLAENEYLVKIALDDVQKITTEQIIGFMEFEGLN